MTWGQWGEEQVERVAAALPEATVKTTDHSAPWEPDNWMGLLPRWMDEVPEPIRQLGTIRRGTLFEVGADVLAERISPRILLLLTVAWGKGRDICGPCVTYAALTTGDAEGKLDRVVTSIREHKVVESYELLADPCRLKEIRPSFGTKFLYFLGAQARSPMPLILDSKVGSRLDRFDVHFRWKEWRVADYSSYLSFMQEVADRVGDTPDGVELRLFS